MNPKIRMFNPQVFLELLCLLCFGGLMVYLVISGKYLSYVTPRMAPYLFFTAVIMGLFFIVGLGRLFRPQHVVRTAHCFVLAIPVLLLLLPHSALSTSNLSGGYVGGSTLNGGTVNQSVTAAPNATQPQYQATDTAQSSDSSAKSPTYGEPSVTMSGLDNINKRITISSEEFYPWLLEIVTHMDNYIGYTVSVTGYVYRDPQYFSQDEFVPARLAMTCCAADLSPIGLLCKYDKSSELTPDSWVTVEGVLKKGQYQGEDEAQIHVTSISPAEAVEGYIYPW